MKRVCALLVNLSIITTYSIAKTNKTDSKYLEAKHYKTVSQRKNGENFKFIKHKIQKGDTLYSVAKKYNTTVSQIETLNKLKKNSTLALGEILKLPSHKATTIQIKRIASTPKIKTQNYTIQTGDTLYSIATNNQMSLQELKDINKLQSNDLTVGKVLKIAQASKSTATSTVLEPQQAPQVQLETAQKMTIASVTQELQAKSQQENEIPDEESYFEEEEPEDMPTITSAASKFASNDDGETQNEQPIRKKKSIFELLGFGSSDSDTSLEVATAKQHLGKKYVWGAVGPQAFDCSGFTKYVCDANGICIPRTSREQSQIGQKVARENLKVGDLIFFDTSRRHRGVNHVGIYLGDDKFIHASSKKRRVVITSLDIPFYKTRFKWGSRI